MRISGRCEAVQVVSTDDRLELSERHCGLDAPDLLRSAWLMDMIDFNDSSAMVGGPPSREFLWEGEWLLLHESEDGGVEVETCSDEVFRLLYSDLQTPVQAECVDESADASEPTVWAWTGPGHRERVLIGEWDGTHGDLYKWLRDAIQHEGSMVPVESGFVALREVRRIEVV